MFYSDPEKEARRFLDSHRTDEECPVCDLSVGYVCELCDVTQILSDLSNIGHQSGAVEVFTI
jgi:hypothetical protein